MYILITFECAILPLTDNASARRVEHFVYSKAELAIISALSWSFWKKRAAIWALHKLFFGSTENALKRLALADFTNAFFSVLGILGFLDRFKSSNDSIINALAFSGFNSSDLWNANSASVSIDSLAKQMPIGTRTSGTISGCIVKIFWYNSSALWKFFLLKWTPA